MALITDVAAARGPTDAEIRQRMVRESVSNFLGARCPCPYSLKRNGELCRDESAYMRGRGGKLYCYPHDITDVMVEQYRARHNLGADDP